MSTTNGAPNRTPDPREWRLNLYPQREGGWGLDLDGHDIASTSAHLDNQAARGWARSALGEGVDFVPALFDDLAHDAIARGQRIDWVAAPHGPLPDGTLDPAVARWRDDHDHLTREALAAYERGDLEGTGEALAHLEVLDDEHHRDTRHTPMQPLSEAEIAEIAALDEPGDEEIEEPEA